MALYELSLLLQKGRLRHRQVTFLTLLPRFTPVSKMHSPLGHPSGARQSCVELWLQPFPEGGLLSVLT